MSAEPTILLRRVDDGVVTTAVWPLSAIRSALSAAGWVVVPREPTEAMLDAAFADAVAWLERVDIGNTDCKSDRERSAEPNRSIYRAMLAAALPAAPQEDKR